MSESSKRKYQRAFHKKHKDKQLAAVKRYQAKNLAVVRERGRQWHHNHPELSMWMRARQRARLRGIPFRIKVSDLVIPKLCPVLGIPLRTGKRGNPHAPSLDRFDNRKGYTRSNIRIISNRANSLKKDGTLKEFEALVRYMKEKPREF